MGKCSGNVAAANQKALLKLVLVGVIDVGAGGVEAGLKSAKKQT